MPHLLVAGTTGSGKSGFINSMLLRSSCVPRRTGASDHVVDPKRVELSAYAGIPHLLTPIITDRRSRRGPQMGGQRDGCTLLRPQILQFRHVKDFNEAVRSGKVHAPAGSPRKVALSVHPRGGRQDGRPYDGGQERCGSSIQRITQLARAAGVHLVLATQRPSVDVVRRSDQGQHSIRLAFATSSATDSRVILDTVGAETLIGQGDALFLPMGSAKPIRVQGSWVSNPRFARPWSSCAPSANRNTARHRTDGQGSRKKTAWSRRGGSATTWTCCCRPAELVVTSQFRSTSMLQRKLRVSFAKAGRLMDLLESRGVVGPSEGSKAREVLVQPQETCRRCSPSSREAKPARSKPPPATARTRRIIHPSTFL